MVRDPLAKRFIEVVRAHVLTRFPYLGNGWTDGAEIWCVVRGLPAMRFTQDGRYLLECTYNRTHSKHIYSLLLVPRPKDVLLVLCK